MIEQTCHHLLTVIEEIARYLDPKFGLKEFCLDCQPSSHGEMYYKECKLSRLCLDCATSSFKERDAFDMAGNYTVREEGDYLSHQFKQCTICDRYLNTPLLTLEGLQARLASPQYSHCPYSYLHLKNTQLMLWETQVICQSALHWVQVLFDSGELPAFVDHIKAFAERTAKVNEHWLTQSHSGFVSFAVKGQQGTTQPILLVEAAYAEGDQNKYTYDMDTLFVNGLCDILGIDSQIWRYADHDRPHNEGR
jgi:hypothetical protein